MSNQQVIKDKMFRAAKWSFLGECATKLVVPFTNMVLARILAPSHFGVLSIVTMITSFADLFTDAGFQKYLVQHYFKTDEELYEYASVAFWTNLVVTTVIWIMIALAAVPLADFLNKPGYQWVIRIGSMKLFLTAFTSVQRAIYQRTFDYKTLFYVRMIVAMVPIVITIPLALLGFQYWALILGTLASEFLYAVILTYKSKWKPTKYYSFEKLKKMFSFSMWSLVEQFTIWLSCYADTLILSVFLTDYMVGMYKQPETMISSIFNVFAASVFGVLFSALSRMNDQNDEKGFWNIVLKTQLSISIIVFPLSVGIYLYRDLVTQVMLGAQWESASIVVGLMALSLGISVVMNNTASEVYRSKGEPKVSVCAQTIFILCMMPILIISIQRGFDLFVKVRALMSILFMVIHYSIIRIRYKIHFYRILNNIKYPVIATGIMFIVVNGIRHFLENRGMLMIVGIPVGICVYTLVACCFRPIRMVALGVLDKGPQSGYMGGIMKVIRKILSN